MLRINIEERVQFTRFRLEGKLTGDWVMELERTWIRSKSANQAKCFKVDLSGVAFVDEKGRALLARLVSDGVELEADNPLMRSVIVRAMEQSRLMQVNS
jgi:ABC-type transporter Mla MlaB component